MSTATEGISGIPEKASQDDLMQDVERAVCALTIEKRQLRKARPVVVEASMAVKQNWRDSPDVDLDFAHDDVVEETTKEAHTFAVAKRTVEDAKRKLVREYGRC